MAAVIFALFVQSMVNPCSNAKVDTKTGFSEQIYWCVKNI